MSPSLCLHTGHSPHDAAYIIEASETHFLQQTAHPSFPPASSSCCIICASAAAKCARGALWVERERERERERGEKRRTCDLVRLIPAYTVQPPRTTHARQV